MQHVLRARRLLENDSELVALRPEGIRVEDLSLIHISEPTRPY